jgi:hypothetical protein
VDDVGVLDRAGDTFAVHAVWHRVRGLGPAAQRLASDLATRGVTAPLLLQ